jgi:hypothetical protein
LVNYVGEGISLLVTKWLCRTPFRKQNVINEGADDKERMDTKQRLLYEPKGRRNIGHHRKRWRHQLQLED